MNDREPDFECEQDADEAKMWSVLRGLMADAGDPGPVLVHDHTDRGHYRWWTETRVYGANPAKREMRSLPRNPPGFAS